MKYLICISAIVLLSWCPIVEGAEWLGEYAGASIPGYEILKSNMMATGKEGGPTSTKLPMISDLMGKCKKDGGIAIVNVRLIFSLGDVTWNENDGTVTKISPGAFGGVYGDCVYKVKPKK